MRPVLVSLGVFGFYEFRRRRGLPRRRGLFEGEAEYAEAHPELRRLCEYPLTHEYAAAIMFDRCTTRCMKG